VTAGRQSQASTVLTRNLLDADFGQAKRIGMSPLRISSSRAIEQFFEVIGGGRSAQRHRREAVRLDNRQNGVCGVGINSRNLIDDFVEREIVRRKCELDTLIKLLAPLGGRHERRIGEFAYFRHTICRT
jgi:hypothetical protein